MNGFVKRQLDLNGIQTQTHQFKQCDKCTQQKPPEGGIQMSLNKWYCAGCWTNRITRRPKNA
jgi:hypothetical protein